MKKSGAFLYTLLPWNFITKFHEGVVVQKDGILQRTFAYRAPDLDSSSGFEINQLSIKINDFAKRLGSGWAFFVEAQRFQTAEYPKEERGFSSGLDALAPYLIEREREEAFRTSMKYFESSYYITIAWKPPAQSVQKLASMFIQGGSGGDESKSIRENVEFFVNESGAVIGLLAFKMHVYPLTNEETAAYLHSSVSFNRHYIRFPFTQIMLDRILPDCELENCSPMRLGGYFIPVIGVNDFPEETYPAVFEYLNRVRLEYRWVTRYICLSKEEAKKEAQKKEKFHRGSRSNFIQAFAAATAGQTGEPKTTNHGASIKEKDTIAAASEIETDTAALGYYTSSVVVWDAGMERALKKAELVRNIINGLGFTCKEEKFNSLEAWAAMMPGQCSANYRSLPIMTYTLSHIVPLSSVWSGMRFNEHSGRVSGVDLPHITCSTHEGTPFYLSLNPGSSDVGHAAIWGPTGAGKSTLLNLLEAQFYRYPNSQIIVFDKGRSCRQICLACGGVFYEPASENLGGISFQPLRELETERDMSNAMDFIEACILAGGGGIPTPAVRSVIKEGLDQLREKKDKDFRSLTSFLQYAAYTDPVTKRPVLNELLGDYLYAGGRYGKIFDQVVPDFSAAGRFLAVEMEELMNRGEGCIVPALVYLFNLVEKKFDGRLTLLVLDEAWLFLKNEAFSEKIAEWLKVLRKKNVFVVFATQDVADVENSPLKTTIVQQCLTKIFLADPSAVSPAMSPVYRAFGLTEAEIHLLAGAQMKRDYFYTSPLGRRMFQLELGRLTLALIGSPRHDLLDALAAEKGAGIPLCREILGSYRINFKRLMRNDAPDEALMLQAQRPPSPAAHPLVPEKAPPLPDSNAASGSAPKTGAASPAGVLDALRAGRTKRREKGAGTRNFWRNASR